MYLLTTDGQVDPVQVDAEVVGDDLGGHGLTGAGRPAEQRGDPLALRHHAVESPLPHDAVTVGDAQAEFVQLRGYVRGQHDVVPAVDRLDLPGQRRQRGSGLPARRGEELPDGQRDVGTGHALPMRRGAYRIAYLAGGEPEPACERIDVAGRRIDAVVQQLGRPHGAARAHLGQRNGTTMIPSTSRPRGTQSRVPATMVTPVCSARRRSNIALTTPRSWSGRRTFRTRR